jgi:hypothetical protein
MNHTNAIDEIDRLTGYKGTIQGGSTECALDEQREALWLAQSIVDSVAGALENHFSSDWPRALPDWPRALRGVSQMIYAATGAIEAGVLEDRGLALARAESAAEAKS